MAHRVYHCTEDSDHTTRLSVTSVWVWHLECGCKHCTSVPWLLHHNSAYCVFSSTICSCPQIVTNCGLKMNQVLSLGGQGAA